MRIMDLIGCLLTVELWTVKALENMKKKLSIQQQLQVLQWSKCSYNRRGNLIESVYVSGNMIEKFAD